MKTVNQDILCTAERLFKQHGYDNTTFEMIAEELGITRAGVVYHYKKKYFILHAIFENYFSLIRRYVHDNLQEGFNYYLYYCIFHICLSREIVKNERNAQLFYHKDYVDTPERERLWDVEGAYRLITENFNKEFTKEELRLAFVMDRGAKFNLFKEFREGDGTITVEKYSYYRVYLMGVLSRLDEATIKKNINRAFEFVELYPPPKLYLFE